MPFGNLDYKIILKSANEKGLPDRTLAVFLQTNLGAIECRLHPAPKSMNGVIWVGGAGGGLDGPAAGMYPRLAAILVEDQITSLRLAYRHPNHMTACILDVLLGITYLVQKDITRIALVGHSFGGAVVITAALYSHEVVGVCTLSSQTAGTDHVDKLNPRSILLMHGTADSVLPDLCSRDIYRRAREPKQLLLYPGCGHGYDECKGEADKDLLHWLRNLLLGTD